MDEDQWEMHAIDESGVEYNLMDMIPLLVAYQFEIESTFEACAVGQTITVDTKSKVN